jgi:hypothetical protein
MSSIREVWALDSTMQKIAEQVQALEEKRNGFAAILRAVRLEIDLRAELPLAQQHILENHLAVRVEPTDLTGLRVCGVDGGLLKKSLRGIELVVTRAHATVFEYPASGRVSAEYFPHQLVPPLVRAELDPTSWRDAEISASLERLKAELQVAVSVQDHHPSELLLLDGSLSPQLGDRPSTDSPFSTKYQEVLSLYDDLYKKSEETGTLLAGVVKDSRSNHFVRVLGELLPHLIRRYPSLTPLLGIDYRSVLRGSYDTDFFFRVLEVGERSSVFRLQDAQRDQVEADTEPARKAQNIVCFYFRTAKYDYPFRVEVFTGSHDPLSIVNKVGAILLPMSSSNEEFGLPAVLIDADSQARLIERDLEFLYKQLAQRIGLPASMLKLRRDRMPFS